jgi:hypothetical protein
MNINISFKPDGTAQCRWTEVLSLHELGRLEITCAPPGMNRKVGNLLPIDHSLDSA